MALSVLSFRAWFCVLLIGLAGAVFHSTSLLAQESNMEFNSATAEELRQREKRIIDLMNRTFNQYKEDHNYISKLVRAKWYALNESEMDIFEKGQALIEDTLIDVVIPKKKIGAILDPSGTINKISDLFMYAQWVEFITIAYNHEMLKKDYTELRGIIEQKSSRLRAQINSLKDELRKLEADKQRARAAGLIPSGGRYEPFYDDFTIRSPDRRGEAEWEFFPATLDLYYMEYEITGDEPEFSLKLNSSDADEVARAFHEYLLEFISAPNDYGLGSTVDLVEDVSGDRQEAVYKYRLSYITGFPGIEGPKGTRVVSVSRVVVKSEPDYIAIEEYTESIQRNGRSASQEEMDAETLVYLAKRK